MADSMSNVPHGRIHYSAT